MCLNWVDGLHPCGARGFLTSAILDYFANINASCLFCQVDIKSAFLHLFAHFQPVLARFGPPKGLKCFKNGRAAINSDKIRASRRVKAFLWTHARRVTVSFIAVRCVPSAPCPVIVLPTAVRAKLAR